MKQNEDLLKIKLNDSWGLFPVRQSIQDGIRSIQFNDFTAFLWDHLDEYSSTEELLNYCREELELSEEELESIRGDIQGFISQMIRQRYIESEIQYIPINHETVHLRIGDLNLHITGRKSVMHESLFSFSCEEDSKPDLNLRLIEGRPSRTRNGKVLIRSEELIIMDCEDTYVLLNPTAESIFEIHILKSGNTGIVFYQDSEQAKEEIFHCIRMIYLYTAMKHGRYAIHSVSVLNDDNTAVLFSALSGTGKSTHAGIWERVYGIKTINGDLNLLGIREGKPVVYGIPWCGTSNIYSEKTYDLKGIVLLRRDKEDVIEELSEEQKIIAVQQRMISPFWTDEDFTRSIEFTKELIQKIKVCRAHVTMNDTAAVTVKEYIDHA